jgi:hypothetical protein
VALETENAKEILIMDGTGTWEFEKKNGQKWQPNCTTEIFRTEPLLSTKPLTATSGY